MASPIIKGHLCVPEQKKVPKIPEGMGMIQPAADVVFKPMIENEIESLLETYKAEADRLHRDIPKNQDPNIIDAFCKGMLFKQEQVNDDLESLLKKYTK